MKTCVNLYTDPWIPLIDDLVALALKIMFIRIQSVGSIELRMAVEKCQLRKDD